MKSITITIRHMDAAFEPDPLEASAHPVEIRMRFETDSGEEKVYGAQIPRETALHIPDYVSRLIKDAYKAERYEPK